MKHGRSVLLSTALLYLTSRTNHALDIRIRDQSLRAAGLDYVCGLGKHIGCSTGGLRYELGLLLIALVRFGENLKNRVPPRLVG